MGAPPLSWVLLQSLKKASRCGDPKTNIANSGSPILGVAGWRRGVLLLLHATGCVGEACSGSPLVLFDGGEPIVEAEALHLLLMVAIAR
jgi:hypothetical protein